MTRLSWRFSLILLVLTFATQASAGQAVRWQSDLEGAKREALRTNRHVLVHYWATWCQNCYKMEAEVFARPDVAAAIHQKFVPVKLNFDHYRADAQAMGVTRLPVDIVIDPNGRIVERFIGRVNPTEYMARLAKIGGNQQGYNTAATTQPGVGNQQPVNAYQPVQPVQTQPAVQTQPVQAVAGQTPPTSDYLGKRYANYRSENLGAAQAVQPSPQYAAQPPVARQPVARQPVARQPVARQPVARQPIAQQPIAQQPVARQPVAQQPVARQPVAANQTSGPRYGQIPTQPQTQAATNPATSGRGLPRQYSPTPLQSAQTQPAPQRNRPATPPAGQPAIRPAVRPPAAQAATGPAPPQFGLDGFCPVSLIENKAWKFGDRRWGATHLGVTYLFTSLANQQKFLQMPDRYSPVGLGNDIVVLISSGKTIPGQRKHGVTFAGRIYLFSNQSSLDAFTKQPRVYIENFSRMMQANRPQYGQNVR